MHGVYAPFGPVFPGLGSTGPISEVGVPEGNMTTYLISHAAIIMAIAAIIAAAIAAIAAVHAALLADRASKRLSSAVLAARWEVFANFKLMESIRSSRSDLAADSSEER